MCHHDRVTTGLRERKKQATRLAIHEAALRLVAERGLEHGWDVVALDRVRSPRTDVVSSVVDLTDFGQAVEALAD